MGAWMDLLLVFVLLLNFIGLGASHLRTVIRAVAAQGVLLGVMMLLSREAATVHVVVLACASMVLKGVVIPRMLLYAMREVNISREVEPIIGFIASLLLGALGTALAVMFAQTLPLARDHVGSMLVPASLATVLCGFLMLTTRRKAITQVLGYLVLENGIFIFGLLLLEAMPFLVEAGVLLDLFVAIFVMGIIIHRISREFSSVNTQVLSALKE